VLVTGNLLLVTLLVLIMLCDDDNDDDLPSPINSIRAVMIVWRLGEKIITTVLYCIVSDSCPQ